VNDTLSFIFFLIRSLIWPLLFLAFLVLSGCDYARMTDDEAINTYGDKMPAMPAHTIPVDKGHEFLRTAEPGTLTNPVPSSPESLARGRKVYDFYCVHCHGPKGDGHGTVGQSFAPLPTDLMSTEVQRQSDGKLFGKISLGYKRHPPLAYTVAEEDRWHVVNFLRLFSPSPSESEK